MQRIVGLILLGFAGLHAAEEEVVTLTDATFDEHINADTFHALVEFYAPWCGHCKQLAPEYEKAAAELKDQLTGVLLAKVDATAETELQKRFEVSSYPTLIWFEKGVRADFDGGRTAELIVEWVLSTIGPAFTMTDNPPEPEVGKPRVVLYSSFHLDGFENAAKALRHAASWYMVKVAGKRPEVTAGEVDEEGLSEMESVPGGVVPKVYVTHRGEEPIQLDIAAAEVAEKQVTNFVKYHSFPLFGKLDDATYAKYKEKGRGLIWALFSGDTADIVRDKGPMMGEIAKKFKAKYSMVYTDTSAFKETIEKMLGLTEASYPAIVVQKKAGDKMRFKHTGPMSGKAIAQFIESVEAGTAKPDLKSEAAPAEEANSEPVRIVVGSTLVDEVFSPTKDVLLAVYAPWCGHCQKLEPEFVKVAKSVKKQGLEDLIQLAKIDGSANDSPLESLDFSGFPTLYYVKAGSSEPTHTHTFTPYDGARTSKALWKWIKDNHSNPTLLKERIEKNKKREL